MGMSSSWARSVYLQHTWLDLGIDCTRVWLEKAVDEYHEDGTPTTSDNVAMYNYAHGYDVDYGLKSFGRYYSDFKRPVRPLLYVYRESSDIVSQFCIRALDHIPFP